MVWLSWRPINWISLPTIFAEAVSKLMTDGGADFGIISANTPHLVFDQVQGSNIATTDQHCWKLRLPKSGRKASRESVCWELASPCRQSSIPMCFLEMASLWLIRSRTKVAYIHDKYVNELLKGLALSDTRVGLERVIARMKTEDQIEAILLAGTELPVILKEDTAAGVPLLDTTKIHVEAAVAQLLE